MVKQAVNKNSKINCPIFLGCVSLINKFEFLTTKIFTIITNYLKKYLWNNL